MKKATSSVRIYDKDYGWYLKEKLRLNTKRKKAGLPNIYIADIIHDHRMKAVAKK